MNHDQRMAAHDRMAIEEYVREVEACLPGPSRERRAIVAELVEHLSDAAAAGELPQALRRLGGPERAGISFAGVRLAEPASAVRRLAAAAIDNLPLIVVTFAVLARDIAVGGQVVAAFPPQVYVRFGDAVCVAGLSGCGAYDDVGPLYTLGVPLALAWSILGLGIVESRTGATPGKLLLGLRVVTETGLRIGLLAGVLRRVSLVVGPLAWLDWVPFLLGRHRRLLDHLAQTKVVLAASPGR